MLRKHEVKEALSKGGVETLTEAFAEAYEIVKSIRYAHDLIKDFREEWDGDEFELADSLEPLAVFNCDNLFLFSKWYASKSDVINKNLSRAVMQVGILQKSLQEALDCSCALEDKEFESLEKQTANVVSGVLFFLLSEFDLFQLASEDPTTDYAVDEIVDGYCKKSGVDAINLAQFLTSLSKEYRIRMAVFDACPEWEDRFHEMMGPLICGVDVEDVTLEQVRSIITGEMTPEDLVAAMNTKEEGETI